MADIFLPEPITFEWDEANKEKSWKKHKVSTKESEQAFFDGSRRLWKDILHSKKELRYIVLGKTEESRLLFIVFTIRRRTVRVISARDADRRERQMYAKSNQK